MSGRGRYSTCVVPGCSKGRLKEIPHVSFHNVQHQWLDFVRTCRGDLSWTPKSTSQLCCLHFDEAMFIVKDGKRYLEDWAMPNISNGNTLTPKQLSGPVLNVTTPNSIYTNPTSMSTASDKEDNQTHEKRETEAATSNYPRPAKRSRVETVVRDFSPDKHIPMSPPTTPKRNTTSSPTAIHVTPTSRPKVKGEHSYANIMSPRTSAYQLRKVQAELEALKKKCALLERKLVRRDRANVLLKDKLKEHCSTHQLEILEEKYPDILKLMISNEKKALSVKGKSGIVYDDEMRKFSATLHYYSPKCYEFLRDHLNLPHPNTIAAWMRSSDCGPGFNLDVISKLGELCRSNPILMKDVCIMIDEMAIKKDLVWNPSKRRFEGHINYGLEDVITDESAPLATSVLVLMLSGLSGGWKVPIGYIFTDHADGSVQRSFVDKAFWHLEAEDFHVHALISDGCPSNVSLFELYGVKEKSIKSKTMTTLDDIIHSFPNPADPDKLVYVIYDVVHMLKLWRNLIAECGTITMANGKTVEWKYIERLEMLQSFEKIRAGNKLGKLHIQFNNHKMRVKLAAQSLSKSVADAMVFCREDLNLREFRGSEGTSEFIYLLDKIFDMLNSRSPYQKGQKAPLTRQNLHVYAAPIFNQFAETALGMKYSETRTYKKDGMVVKVVKIEKQLCQSLRKRAALGLISSMLSEKAIADALLYREERPFRYVMTYRFSQDLLELFFNTVRGRLGRNNNPNTVEFHNIMKVVWHVNPLKSSSTGNCVVQTVDEILPGGLLQLKPCKKLQAVELDELLELDSVDLSAGLNTQYTDFAQNCIAYISGNVIRVVGTKSKCEECAESLLNNDEDPLENSVKLLIDRKDRGGLFVPCNSVYKIVKTADIFFRRIVAATRGSLNISMLDKKIAYLVMRDLLDTEFFPHAKEHFSVFYPSEPSHLSTIISEIIHHYLRIRLFDHGRRYQAFKADSSRHKLNKLTLFKNQ